MMYRFKNCNKPTIYSWRGWRFKNCIKPTIYSWRGCTDSRTVLNPASIAGEDVEVQELFKPPIYSWRGCIGS